MKEEILTAKEWLFENEPYFKKMGWNTNPNIDDEWVAKSMEQYANYKNKVLEDKIIYFRNRLKDIVTMEDNANLGMLINKQGSSGIITKEMKALIDKIEDNFIVKEYDKHFNIKNERI